MRRLRIIFYGLLLVASFGIGLTGTIAAGALVLARSIASAQHESSGERPASAPVPATTVPRVPTLVEC